MTTSDMPGPDHGGEDRDADRPQAEGAPGVEMGLSEDGGSTFEPEEDPEAGD